MTGSASEEAYSLRNQFGTKSGPVALWMFKPWSATATCEGSITYWLP